MYNVHNSLVSVIFMHNILQRTMQSNVMPAGTARFTACLVHLNERNQRVAESLLWIFTSTCMHY